MAAGPDMTVLPQSTIDLESIFSTRRKARMTPAATNHKRKAAGDAPRSGSEWRTALREVKREYFIGKYRSCVSRCDDLLAGAKITVSTLVHKTTTQDEVNS